jgi:hypothetical protein
MSFNRLILWALPIVLLTGFSVRAEIAKKDLRSAPVPSEQFIFFCADQGDERGVVGFVSGNQASGFLLEDWFLGGQRTPSGREREAQQSYIEQCVQATFSDRSQTFVAEIDNSVFLQAKDALLVLRTKGTKDTLDFEIAVGQIIGLRLPTTLEKQFAYIKDISALNASPYEGGGQWIWQPPAIKMRPESPASLLQAPASSDQAAAPPEEIPIWVSTGLKSVESIDARALKDFYQALADAEDNSNVSYVIELAISNKQITNVYVHPTEMMRDVTTLRGSAACIFTNPDTKGIDFAELMNTLLSLASVHHDEIGKAWGFPANHPLLGAPENWQAAVTSPPACYLSANEAPAAVALAPLSPGMRYLATLVRGIARFPGDLAAFNDQAPLKLTSYQRLPELTSKARAFNNYTAAVSQTTSAAKVRAGTFARLSATQIAKRRAYSAHVGDDDDLAFNFRSYFRIREIGWHDFQANKYKGLQDDQLERYSEGQKAIYQQFAHYSEMHKSTIDVGPPLTAQANAYADFMKTSILLKKSVADTYDPNLTPLGRVCKLLPTYCSTSVARAFSDTARPLVWTFGDQTQTKVTNIFHVGQFSTTVPVSLPQIFGANPANANCFTSPAATNPLQFGTQTFELNISNPRTVPAKIALIYAGSFVRAYWKDDPDLGQDTTLAPAESKTLVIEFVPMDRYEDFNGIFLLEGGQIVSHLLIDYSIIEDSNLKVMEFTTGLLNSGTNDQKIYYDIVNGKAPRFYAVAKGCLWLTGNRSCAAFADCIWKSTAADNVTAVMGPQGHDDKDSGLPYGVGQSAGHVRIAYEVRNLPPSLE